MTARTQLDRISTTMHGSRPTRARLAMAAFVAAVALLGAGTDAHAQSDDIKCAFLEIEASDDAGGVDKKLAKLDKKFKAPPFTVWKSFKLSARHDETLSRGKAKDIKLKLGGKLTATYQDHAAGKKTRYTVSIVLTDKKKKQLFKGKMSMDSGDYALVTPEPRPTGAIIFASTCK